MNKKLALGKSSKNCEHWLGYSGCLWRCYTADVGTSGARLGHLMARLSPYGNSWIKNKSDIETVWLFLFLKSPTFVLLSAILAHIKPIRTYLMWHKVKVELSPWRTGQSIQVRLLFCCRGLGLGPQSGSDWHQMEQINMGLFNISYSTFLLCEPNCTKPILKSPTFVHFVANPDPDVSNVNHQLSLCSHIGLLSTNFRIISP